jgi:hypothetical protein
VNKLTLASLSALALAGAVLPATVNASADAPHEHDDSITLAVYGDSPYGLKQGDTAQLLATPAFIGSINADPDVSLVLHAGDIHSGKEWCTVAYDTAVRGLWDAFQDPLVYTPGDNEWADCHKVKQGGGSYDAATGLIKFVKNGTENASYEGGNPVANLDLVRSLFFNTPGRSLGQTPIKVTSQATKFSRKHPADSKYVENVRFERDDVVFITVNIPGGSNNDNDIWYGTPTMSDAQRTEIDERTAADLRWIQAGFRYASEEDAKAVVVMEQADMWDLDGNVKAHLSQYDQFVNAIADATTAFGKPVLLLNGDSHNYLSDNPLAASDPLNYLHDGHDVSNFHRIAVHGSTSPMEWLKLTVDTEVNAPLTATTFGPFSWARQIQG